LAYLAQQANLATTNTSGKYYKLTTDIDLNGPTNAWTPIGSLSTAAFAGVFDGDNHSVSNIFINSVALNQGLFGYVVGSSSANPSAVVKNILIASGSVATTANYAAAIAARCQYAQIINCKSAIAVTGLAYTGGIVGRADGVSIIESCGNSGAIKSTASASAYTAGIVGAFMGLSTNSISDMSYVRNCFNTGAVNAASYSGGIVGNGNGNLTIDKCFNTATISVTSGAGGIIGYGYTNTSGVLNISNCYNTGAIKASTSVAATSCAGGIIGYVGSVNTRFFGTIVNCYNMGTISGYVKEPIAGQLYGATGGGTGTVTNSYFLSTSGTNVLANNGTSAEVGTLQGAASTLNNSQTPAVWSSDLSPNINGGYPVLMWQLSAKSKPSYQVTGITKGALSNSSVQLNWVAALTGSQTPDGYLVKVSDASVADPVDGVDPADMTTVTGGIANVKVTPYSLTTFTPFTNMLPGTMYNYKIYSYTNSGVDIAYNTTAAPSVNVATLPTEVKGVAVASTGTTTATVTWNLPTSYNASTQSTLVFVKANAAVTGGTPTQSPALYAANPAFASGTAFQNDAAAYCVYKGDGATVSITGLNTANKYSVLVYTVVDASNFDATNSYSVGANEAIYWTGAAGTDTNWSNAANWSGKVLPSSKDQVCILGGYTVTVSTNVGAIDKLRLGTTTDATQTKLVISATGSLSVNSTSLNQTQIALQGGAIENAGSLTVTTGAGSADGISFSNAAGTTVAASSYSGAGSLIINTESTGNQGACIHFQQKDANSSFSTNGTVSLCAASGMYAINLSDGNATLGGTGTINAGSNVPYGLLKINGLTASASLSVASGLTINSFSRSLSTSTGAVYLGTSYANKLINGGSLNIGGSSANGIYSEPLTSVVNEITNTGTLNISGSLSQAAIYIAGAGTTQITNSGTFISSGNGSAEGITVKSNVSTTTINNSGTMNFGENGSNSRSIALGDGKSVFNNSGSIVIGKGNISGTVGTAKAQFNNNTGGTVNFNSPWAAKTTKISDIQLGSTASLGFFAEKVRNKVPVNICYIGGSITFGSGSSVSSASYYSKSSAAIKAEIVKRGGTATTYNAGIGGTPSSYGAYRLGAQVLNRNPDLLIVEFAVNDANASVMDRINGIEGIVRQAIRQNPQMGILFLYTSMVSYQNSYFSQGNVTPSIDCFHKVALQYGIAEVMTGPAVQQGLDAGTFTLASFFPDGTHPSDIGHALYANALAPVVIQGLDQPMPAVEKNLNTMVGTGALEYARLDPITTLGSTQYWTPSDTQYNWYGVRIWKTDSLAAPISFVGKGESIKLHYNGKISVSWKHAGVVTTQVLTGVSGLPSPNSWTFPTLTNPDGDTITVQAVANTAAATHGEVWGLFSIQRPLTGNGRLAAPARISKVIPVVSETAVPASNLPIQKVLAAAAVTDSIGIANDLVFNNNGGTVAGSCGVITDSFVSGSGTLSPGGSGIGVLNLFANAPVATYLLTGTLALNASAKAVAGKDYDQIKLSTADATLDISGATLQLSAGYTPAVNDTLVLLTAVKSVVGKFSAQSIPQGWSLLYGVNYVKAVYGNLTGNSTTIGYENASVFGTQQAIVVKGCQGVELILLNAVGQVVKTITPLSNHEIIPCQKGIYIVKSSKLPTCKIVVN